MQIIKKIDIVYITLILSLCDETKMFVVKFYNNCDDHGDYMFVQSSYINFNAHKSTEISVFQSSYKSKKIIVGILYPNPNLTITDTNIFFCMLHKFNLLNSEYLGSSQGSGQLEYKLLGSQLHHTGYPMM